MSETKKKPNDERVNAIKITDNNGIIREAGEVYELDFNRDAIRFAEARGFKPEEITDFPVTRVPELFYYSFRMNHRNVAKDKTDKFMEAWGGLPKSVLERLVLLYNQAAMSNTFQLDEDAGKNSVATVEMD